MLVNTMSWHYKLVKHKMSFSNPQPGNKDAISYIGEVALAVWLISFIIPFILIALTIGHKMMVSEEFDQMVHSEYSMAMYIFCVIMSFPLWFSILLMIIEPFTRKKWRTLELK